MNPYRHDIAVQFRRLHHLIKRSDIRQLRRELEAGLNPNFENRYGWTMLMLTAAEGNVSIGEMLLSYGADPNRITRTSPGQDALSLAVICGHVRFLKMLLDHGGKPDLLPTPAEKWVNVSQAKPEARNRMLSLLRK